MLKPSILLLFSFFVMLFASCAERPITPNSVYAFDSPEQQRQFEKRALAGDIAAANRLAMYYQYWHYDKAQAVNWYKVATAHGDTTAKQSIRTITEGE
jgi:TPR repeat protein